MPQFCDKCGGSMSVIETEEGRKLKCDICGNIQAIPEGQEKSISGKTPVAKGVEEAESSSEIIYEGEMSEEQSTVERECPDCGHVGAYKREITTTFAKAESKTMYTCTECGYSWEG